MDPALTEALAALRVLSDPTRAFGANRARGMQAFAAAAHERVIQLRESGTEESRRGSPPPPGRGPGARECSPAEPLNQESEGEVLAGPTRHPEHAESWATVFRQRGIRCAVVKEQGGVVVRCDP